MQPLEKTLRNKLERTVKEARDVAEAAAKAALEQLGVGDAAAPSFLSAPDQDLRRRLRVHGRQLGDSLNGGKVQTMERLIEEVAYEHWHRMLFARFLAENDLLMYPDPANPVPVTLEECDDLAKDDGAKNGWELASRFATKMLPQIFRPDSPVFELSLPPERQQKLEALAGDLESEVFHASDSLGWVYQFWQARRKDEVNAAGNKIGARELPSVTQLFTEDYMVDFLLDNTLGAWHAGKVLAANPNLAETARSEDELRQAVGLPGCLWKYLRFNKGNDGKWTPAAGTFDRWPKIAQELKCLDPCMGSGHFVVAMFEQLVALRMAEEKLDEAVAVAAVIRDNLFGLEIDPRCTQIGAFNLALAAWRRVGFCILPAMNLACSGLAPNASKEDWLKLTAEAPKLRFQMGALYDLFEKAPVLGSLINPRADKAVTYGETFHELQPLLEKALEQETKDDTAHEMAVTARGLAKATEILAGEFTLVATNVPYLGREGHADDLITFADGYAPDASADLATLMLHRCLQFTGRTGVIGVVLPQNWWVGKSYSNFRTRVLGETNWRFAAVLGEEAWQAFGNRGPNTILLVIEGDKAGDDNAFSALDVSTKPGTPVVGPETKARALAGDHETEELERLSKVIRVGQRQLSLNREARISVAQVGNAAPLSKSVISGEGCSTGDNDHFLRSVWELSDRRGWLRYAGPGFGHWTYCDNSLVVLWEDGNGELARSSQARIQNTELWERSGILVGRVRGITATLFSGGCFSKGAVLVCPRDITYHLAIYAFLKSRDFENVVRTIDPRVSAATSVLTDVPFDLSHWQKVAAEKYPHGLPKPFSSDPTQWLFNGHPAGSDQPLHVALARLLGYKWPRQTGSSFPDCPELGPDGLETLEDDDSIVCIPPVRGEAKAADRLLNLLAAAYGNDWSSAELDRLLTDSDYSDKGLEAWLREKFFAEHCKLFHNRPFIWHIWDGLRDGFAALVNYHKLDYKNLETLIYTYLGDWISRQKQDIAAGVDGAKEKRDAAEALKKKLELILHGEAPYDIFVRWKPIEKQAIGWNPDINDGVRLNIRPFLSVPDVGKRGAGVLRERPNIKWDKDRGKDLESAPWYRLGLQYGGKEGDRINDHHLTLEEKRIAKGN